ncbi:unnamed protein product [Phytophthora fragariaefolia]|uniref:Unnamed protein product n=1 Tax=Phytophthora fragariaefolia TaxID=1490495 RepID=A0A9W6TQA9_9STRA|nr:unnamed protein product [Phytophthora fragariaefolia]
MTGLESVRLRASYDGDYSPCVSLRRMTGTIPVGMTGTIPVGMTGTIICFRRTIFSALVRDTQISINRQKMDQEETLLSFGSPRRGFSASVHGSVDEPKLEGEGGKNATELLAFYRQRCEQFHTEREQTLAHLAQIEVRNVNAVKAELIDLQAENKTLKLQEQDDRQKIQHLLELTQPITEQVTFFRDCRPGTRTTYPSGRAPTSTTYPYPSTMHIGSEGMHEKKKKKHQQSQFVVRGNAPSLKKVVQSIPSSKVLRTVYMPNEQTAVLTKTIENLQKQLESHQQLTETRIQVKN